MKNLNIKLRKTAKTINGGNNHRSMGDFQFAGRAGGSTNGNCYNGYVQSGRYVEDSILAVHLEKRRGHWEEKEVIKKGRKTPIIEKVWVPTFWIRTVTYIPLDLFKYLPQGSKFVQHKHHWELITAK